MWRFLRRARHTCRFALSLATPVLLLALLLFLGEGARPRKTNGTPLLVPYLGIPLSNLWFIQVTEQVIHRGLRNTALVAMKGETFATPMLKDTGSHKFFIRLLAPAVAERT